jgi:hypothetical protein
MIDKNSSHSSQGNEIFTQYALLPRGYQENIVEGRYKLNLGTQISELSNEFCTYYIANDLENDLEYFAIVFEKNFAPNPHLLQISKNSRFDGLNNILAYAIIRISEFKAYRLVAIVEKYDYSSTIEKHISKNIFSYNKLEEFIIRFTSLLEQLDRVHIRCGNIHPSNIIIKNDGSLMLREIISSHQGFYQEFAYVAPEIAECLECGRVAVSQAADIYALAVTCFFAITAKRPWLEYEHPSFYNEDRFEQGSFRLLLGKRKLPENIRYVLRWMMQDDPIRRWKARNIIDSIANNTDKSFRFEKLSDASNLIAFNGRNYSNLKSIAYAMFCNWQEALSFISDDKLIKWIQRNVAQTNIVEPLQELIDCDFKAFKSGYENEKNRKLTKLLSIIDPQGPIRQEGIAFSVASIPTALQYLHSKNRRLFAEGVLKAIREEYWKFGDLQTQLGNDNSDTECDMQKVGKAFISSNPMFSIERVIYSLNHYAACMSPSISDEYVFTLRDLLSVLDAAALKMQNRCNIDRHIIAFISAKISLNNESEVKILPNFSVFSDHYLIHGLSVLSIAQQFEKDMKLPHLCNVMADMLSELFLENLHNVRFKTRLAEELKEQAASGNLSDIVKKIRNNNEFIEDYNGYHAACNEIEQLDKQIEVLKSEDEIFDGALFFGQKLTVLISYVLCFSMTVMLVI